MDPASVHPTVTTPRNGLSEKAFSPIVLTLLGRVMLGSLLQFRKACSPIVSTPSGSVTLVITSKPQKACFPMPVTPASITTVLIFFSRRSFQG